jgi:hypothetical protein
MRQFNAGFWRKYCIGSNQGLRVMTGFLSQAVFVSLCQAGEGIYDLFDKVIVITQGRLVYFCPAYYQARVYLDNPDINPSPDKSLRTTLLVVLIQVNSKSNSLHAIMPRMFHLPHKHSRMVSLHIPSCTKIFERL